MILKIYLYNLISDLDNLLIITTVVRKYGYEPKRLFFYIVVCLTASRTIYVAMIQYLTGIPGFRVLAGMILLYIAFRFVSSIQPDSEARPVPSIPVAKMLLIVLAADFLVCMDSVLITSGISGNLLYTMAGMALSLTTVLAFFEFFSEILDKISLVQIVAGGLTAHVAVTGIFKDPVMKYPVSLLEKVWGFQLNEWIDFIALDAAIFLILAGFMIKARNRA